jgi:solute carrier family 13 (sodium-dependent dicarboxylate transporter), member 2/3/5
VTARDPGRGPTAAEPGRRRREPRPARDLPLPPKDIYLAPAPRERDWVRLAAIAAGLAVLALSWLLPHLPDAVDPEGRRFALTREAQTALGLFVFAALWWAFEVVPIGVTGLAVGALQVLLSVRPPQAAMGDFFDPAMWFVLGSLVVGMAFARTGLTQRLAYPLLLAFGERTPLIYLGAFTTTGALSLVMAHTAAAAAVFPLLMAIYPLYDEGRHPTRFGKGLFIGMAMTAGASSIVTLLGSGRAAVGAGFFEQMAGREISFFTFSYYLLPLGAALVLALWVLMLALFPPEKPSIAGLRQRLQAIHRKLGTISARELVTLAIVAAMLVALALGRHGPAAGLHRSAVVAAAVVALFLTGVLRIDDLETIPWNIVLLFGGATSIGLCLWQTGAARWVAVRGLAFWPGAHWLVFVLGLALVVVLLTNVVVNVAVLALVLPVGLAAAPYLGISPEVVFYATVSAAGLPLFLLIGAAPNAMAYESRQFTSREFLRAGIPATAVVLAVLALFALVVWPAMGMPVGTLPIRH